MEYRSGIDLSREGRVKVTLTFSVAKTIGARTIEAALTHDLIIALTIPVEIQKQSADSSFKESSRSFINISENSSAQIFFLWLKWPFSSLLSNVF